MIGAVEDRFWAKVDKGPDCWLWRAGKSIGNYGLFYAGGGAKHPIRTYAHRWSYEQAFGPVPDGLELDHLCRVRACVRPDHLEPVTHAENHRRRAGIRTGPYRVGDTCPSGHSRTEHEVLNTYGFRRCRQCSRDVSARARERKKSNV